MNQSCRVCGEVAAGYHFGAFTCEGCKSFFGRTYNNRSSIGECKNQNLCVINKKNRTSCKSCRLKKCFQVGMSKSGSRYGRRSNWFKIHCLLQDQGIIQQQQQQTNSQPPQAHLPTPTSGHHPTTIVDYSNSQSYQDQQSIVLNHHQQQQQVVTGTQQTPQQTQLSDNDSPQAHLQLTPQQQQQTHHDSPQTNVPFSSSPHQLNQLQQLTQLQQLAQSGQLTAQSNQLAAAQSNQLDWAQILFALYTMQFLNAPHARNT